MKTLYFDIDGTVLLGSALKPKALLADGGFECALRAAGFERLVCVGNVVAIIQGLVAAGRAPDGLGMVFRVCSGTFVDERWFRTAVVLVEDSANRVSHIDRAGDWWYLDDLAPYYCERAGVPELLDEHRGRRIGIPQPESDGDDVLAWLHQAARW